MNVLMPGIEPGFNKQIISIDNFNNNIIKA